MISRLLFESPWLLLIILALIQIGILTIWWWRRDGSWTRAVWVGFAALPTLLALSLVVVTPTERIVHLCRELASMVDSGDVTGIGRHVADDFEAADFGKSEFLQRAGNTLKRFQVDNARLRAFEVEFPAHDQGLAVFNAVCRIRSTDFVTDWMLSRWRVTFRYNGTAWKVTRIEALPTPFSPIRNVRECLQ